MNDLVTNTSFYSTCWTCVHSSEHARISEDVKKWPPCSAYVEATTLAYAYKPKWMFDYLSNKRDMLAHVRDMHAHVRGMRAHVRDMCAHVRDMQADARDMHM
jgi:hypothetical protein